MPGSRPLLSTDESRLQQLEDLISTETARRAAEDARRAEEDARRAQEDAKRSYTLDELVARRVELRRELLERESHVRLAEQRDALQSRAKRLAAEIEGEEIKNASRRAELSALAARLP